MRGASVLKLTIFSPGFNVALKVILLPKLLYCNILVISMYFISKLLVSSIKFDTDIEIFTSISSDVVFNKLISAFFSHHRQF